MVDIVEHDSLIRTFLKNKSVKKRLSNCLASENETNLFDHLLRLEFSSKEPLTNSQLSDDVVIDASILSNITKPGLNGVLKEFCKRYEVAPLIQLYFRTNKSNMKPNYKGVGYSNIGAHFACVSCYKNDHTSGSFVTIDELKKCLTNALSKIASIGIQEALQILEPPSSIQPDKLKLFKPTITKLKKGQSPLSYKYCWPETIYGRNKEKKQLLEFVNYEGENLVWWAITGNGGIGKSRLALDLCYKLEKDWHAGFLMDPKEIDVLSDWKPTRPTLIVIDYTYEKSKKFGECINNYMYENSKQWDFPVRILFLERHAKSEALKQFWLPDPDIIKENLLYRNSTNDDKSSFLELKSLSDKAIDSITTEVFLREKKEKPSKEILETIRIFLKEKVRENNPLYAMILAEACTRNEKVQEWDIEKLLDRHLGHTRKIWLKAGIDETNSLDKKHINLLTFITMTSSIYLGDYTYVEWLKVFLNNLSTVDIFPAVNKFSNSKYQVLSSYDASRELSQMAPDILGEYFVLKRFKGDMAEIYEMELLIKIAWQFRPGWLIDFITRAAIDFPNDSALDKIIGYSKTNEVSFTDQAILLSNLMAANSNIGRPDEAARHLDSFSELRGYAYREHVGISITLSVGIVYLVSAFIKARKLTKAVEYYDHLVDLWKSHEENEHISKSVAQAAIGLTIGCCNAGETNKASNYFDYAEKVWKRSHQNDRDFSWALARAANSIIFEYDKAEQIDKVVEYYDRLEDLWKHGYQKDREISVVLVGSAFYLMNYYHKVNKVDKKSEYFDRVEVLLEYLYQEERLFSVGLVGIAVELIDCYGKAGQIEKAAKYYKRLEKLWEGGYQEDKEISTNLINATNIMATVYYKAGKLDKALECFDDLEKLWPDVYQESRGNSVSLAQVITDLSVDYSKAGKLDKVVELFERLEKLWEGGYQEDKDISTALALVIRILVITDYYNNETGRIDDVVKYYNRLEGLWKHGYQKDKNISLCLAKIINIIVRHYSKGEESDKAVKYYVRLEKLWNSGYQKDKEISAELAEVMYVLINTCCYNDTGRTDAAVKYYVRLEGLWNRGYQGDKNISLLLAQAACSLMIYCVNTGLINDSLKYYKCIDHLWEGGYQKDKDISDCMAAAIYHIVHYYGETEEPDNAVKYYNRIEELWNSGYQKDKDISLSLARVVFNLIYHYVETGEPDNAVKYYNRIEELWNSGYQKDEDISDCLAATIYRIARYYSKGEESDKAVKYYNRIEELWNSGYQEDKEISLSLARVVVDLIYYYVETGESYNAVKYYNRIEELWNSGYQKDKKISAILAIATGMCSGMFDKKGKTSISKQYKKKFIELSNSFPESEAMAAIYKDFF